MHLVFEHDVLQKVMLTAIEESCVQGAKPIEKILISVLYNYCILKEACQETQNEWKVGLTIFLIYQVIQARHTNSILCYQIMLDLYNRIILY